MNFISPTIFERPEQEQNSVALHMMWPVATTSSNHMIPGHTKKCLPDGKFGRIKEVFT